MPPCRSEPREWELSGHLGSKAAARWAPAVVSLRAEAEVWSGQGDAWGAMETGMVAWLHGAARL